MPVRNDQLPNQCRNLWRATLKPSTSHKWPAGRVLDAPTLNACALCFLPFITFDSVRSSFTKCEDMFPVILALCFILKIFRCSEHYASLL